MDGITKATLKMFDGLFMIVNVLLLLIVYVCDQYPWTHWRNIFWEMFIK